MPLSLGPKNHFRYSPPIVHSFISEGMPFRTRTFRLSIFMEIDGASCGVSSCIQSPSLLVCQGNQRSGNHRPIPAPFQFPPRTVADEGMCCGLRGRHLVAHQLNLAWILSLEPRASLPAAVPSCEDSGSGRRWMRQVSGRRLMRSVSSWLMADELGLLESS